MFVIAHTRFIFGRGIASLGYFCVCKGIITGPGQVGRTFEKTLNGPCKLWTQTRIVGL